MDEMVRQDQLTAVFEMENEKWKDKIKIQSSPEVIISVKETSHKLNIAKLENNVRKPEL